MALFLKAGQPWRHSGGWCDGCHNPFVGNCYLSNKRNYGLCSKCYRKNPEEDLVYKLGRNMDSRPYQIHCIDCDGCGVSPITGPRYRHKLKENWNLCSECFSEATDNQGEDLDSYDLVEHTPIKSITKNHQPVFHFTFKCDGCGVCPITGPLYDSKKDSDYQLCLICYDSRLTAKLIEAQDFTAIFRPHPERAIHVLIHSCAHCNATPICGPAYMSQMRSGKALCLLCFLNVAPEKRALYQRLEPPLAWNVETMGKFDRFGKKYAAGPASRERAAAGPTAAGQTVQQLSDQMWAQNRLQQSLMEMELQRARWRAIELKKTGEFMKYMAGGTEKVYII